MIGLVLVTHGLLAKEFVVAMEHVVGPQDAIRPICIGPEDDMETRRMIAATLAGDLCRRLQAEGIRDFHFYTLNRADLTFAICHLLGVRPQKTQE